MILADKKTVKIEHEFACSVDKLFSAWTGAEMPRWWNALKTAEMDLKPGGKIQFTWHGWDGVIYGEVKEVIPNEKISFTWQADNEAPSLETLQFEKSGTGSKLTLVHSDNPSYELALDHNHGWMDCLNDLDKDLNPKERPESLTVERTFAAPIDMVFDAWTDPEKMLQWWAPTRGSRDLIALDFKESGNYTLQYIDENGINHVHYGKYLEIDRPNRLKFTWISDHTAGETVVTINFSTIGENTKLVLQHDLFRTRKSREQHNEGWTDCLKGMQSIFQ